MKTFRRLHIIALCSVAVLIAAMASAAEPPESADGSKPAQQRRRMTPVTTAATTTQSVNETRNDTARINAERRARSTTYINKEGRTVYVDTVSGEEWIDSLAAGRRVPPMKYPLFHSLAVGVNLWDPVMRAFGQHYGLADAWLELSIHNRYNPVVELGLPPCRTKLQLPLAHELLLPCGRRLQLPLQLRSRLSVPRRSALRLQPVQLHRRRRNP